MIQLTCPAKFNLYLAILGQDSSGYHELETILVKLPQLADQIQIEAAEQIQLSCSDPSIPTDESNSIHKALAALREHTGLPHNYKIHLQKNIPAGSGFGGASSNAASILKFVNDHENLQLSQEQLLQLAAQVGMDTPCFILPEPVVLARHYGEQVEALPDLPQQIQVQIHEPNQTQLTQAAYAAWDAAGLKSTARLGQFQELIEAIKKQDAEAILQHVHNDFHQLTQPSEKLLLAGSGAGCVALSLVDSSTPNTQKEE